MAKPEAAAEKDTGRAARCPACGVATSRAQDRTTPVYRVDKGTGESKPVGARSSTVCPCGYVYEMGERPE
jgi:hypothetical protein